MQVKITAKMGSVIEWPIYTKVAGVTGKNEDGEHRQDILSWCEVGEELVLSRDDYNEFDENAIEVLTMDFRKIGYIQRGLAAKLAPLMDDGQDLYCEVENITGGEEGKETLGCNIRIKPSGKTSDPLAGIKISVPADQPTVADEPKKKRTILGLLWGLVKFVLITIGCLVAIVLAVGFIKGW